MASSLTSYIGRLRSSTGGHSVGASGAVYACFAAVATLYPGTCATICFVVLHAVTKTAPAFTGVHLRRSCFIAVLSVSLMTSLACTSDSVRLDLACRHHSADHFSSWGVHTDGDGAAIHDER